MKNRKIMFYYGNKIPNITETRKLTCTDVVLQPGHPIVRENKVASFFPKCRVYLYWNPVSIDREEFFRSKKTYKVKEKGSDWDTFVLDLEDKETLGDRIDKAKSLAETRGVRGLFVDDLDIVIDRLGQDDLAGYIVESLRETPLFINRAFKVWQDCELLDAVLLESLSLFDVERFSTSDLEWLDAIFDIHMKLLQISRKNTAVYALSYTKSH